MPERATILTAAAGEHFIAYKLSALGYPVALTRSGSPTIDLMVGDLKGEKSIMIQVKTSNWARRIAKRKPENSGWTWDVGKKALYLKGENIFYAFVDLKWSYETYKNIFKTRCFYCSFKYCRKLIRTRLVKVHVLDYV